MQITLKLGHDVTPLPDHECWENRFKFWDSDRREVITIGQHKTTRGWACTCPTWKHYYSTCPHLAKYGLPTNGEPCEVIVSGPHASIMGLRRLVNQSLRNRAERDRMLAENDSKGELVEAAIEFINSHEEPKQPDLISSQLILDVDDV